MRKSLTNMLREKYRLAEQFLLNKKSFNYEL